MPVAATPFWQVGPLLARFVEMGCELRVAEATIEGPDGDCYNLRYLLNTATGQHVALVDLADDHLVPEGDFAYWERRLGVNVSRPGQDH